MIKKISGFIKRLFIKEKTEAFIEPALFPNDTDKSMLLGKPLDDRKM